MPKCTHVGHQGCYRRAVGTVRYMWGSLKVHGLIVSAMRALCLSGAVGGARIYILQKQCEAWTIYRIASISAPLLPVYIIDYHYIIIPYVSFVLLSAAPPYSA